MNKQQLMAMGLTDEQADKVLEGYKGYIPKDRFDEVNNAKKDLEKQLSDRDTQLETLKKGATNNEELTKQINDLQAENTRIKAESEQKVKDMEKDNLLVTTLKDEYKSKDPNIILSLIDKSKITVDNGKLIGFKEIMEPIVKEKDFLFEPVKQDNKQPGFIGVKPGEGDSGTPAGQQTTGGGLKSGLSSWFTKQQENINN